MDIKIEKEKIIDELHRLSAHLGNKLSLPELVASTNDDVVKIDVMLSASYLELLKLLSPYASLRNDGDTTVYELKMPVNWKAEKATNLTAYCSSFLLYSLFARWLDFIKSDSATLYRALNAENASAITHLLSLREKPSRG